MGDTIPQDGINLSDDAAARISDIMAGEGGGRLRIVVTGGGCSGFQYHFTLDEGPEEGDVEYGTGNARVVIDDISLRYLAGSTLRFVNSLEGSYFTLDNPNATSSCGCGTSFAI